MDVNTAEHSTVITFSDYHEGSAPALVINHTSQDVVTYKQRYEEKGSWKISFAFYWPTFLSRKHLRW